MKPNALAACNSRLIHENNVYRDTAQPISSSDLSSYLTIAVPQLLASESDKSLFSVELERLLHTRELRHEFSYASYNMLRACDFQALANQSNALDLSQDFGGTADFLAEHFEHVDAVKTDLARASLSQQRCTDSDNIDHFCYPLDSISLPEQHYDFIFIGKLEDLRLDKQKTHLLLQQLNTALTEHGVLVISLKNRDRLSKWLNTDRHEYDQATPHTDLYGFDAIEEFNLVEAKSALQSCGFSENNINASFSARSTVPNLFSLDYLKTNANALNHFYRIGSVASSSLNEYLMYKELQNQDESLGSLASRYVIFAGHSSSTVNAIYTLDFAHFPGVSRKARWRAITSKQRNSDIVTKQSSHKSDITLAQQSDGLLSQNLEPQAFQKGPLLLDAWLSAISDNNAQEFTSLVKRYHKWLTELAGQSDDTLSFSKVGYDLLPFNIVCEEVGPSAIDQDGTSHSIKSYHIIDPEWCINTKITEEFVVFRALFWFAFENRALMANFCDKWGFENIDSFVRHYLNEVNPLAEQSLGGFIELEESVQLEISNTFNAMSVGMSLQQNFTDRPAIECALPMAQMTWADEHDQFDQANAVYIEWQHATEHHELIADFKSYDPSKRILRVDPIDNTGLFHFDAVTLLDDTDTVIWQLSSSKDIGEQAKVHNVSVFESSTDQSNNFIALNSDPFFLFDLSQLSNLESVRRIKIKIGLTFEPNYHKALDHLRNLVGQQAESIIKLGNKGHETRADIDLLKAQLQHTENQHNVVSNRLLDMDKIMEQNEQLRFALTQTPSKRLKRFIKKVFRLN